MRQRINRLKVISCEKQRTNKLLVKQSGRKYSTVSKWCRNTNQLDLVSLAKIAYLLDVDIRELLVSGKSELGDFLQLVDK